MCFTNRSYFWNLNRQASVGSQQRFYIAAQGPTAHTLPSFWHCIWEAEVYLIVQLTDSTEDLSYLPDSTDRCVDVGGQVRKYYVAVNKKRFVSKL